MNKMARDMVKKCPTQCSFCKYHYTTLKKLVEMLMVVDGRYIKGALMQICKSTDMFVFT